MPKIRYIEKSFQASTRAIIKRANDIIEDFAGQGFSLTLRQLYYQFIAQNKFPDSWIDENYNREHGLALDTKNTNKNYDRLGAIINNARLAGLIDWKAIEDRTRFIRELAHWDDPADIVSSVAQQFRVDMWEGQKYRPEVWIEKDALVGIFERVCQQFDVPLFSCRGYTSQSEMWVAANRIQRTRRDGQFPVVMHFGDHDPSGVDMSRDIEDRITLFTGGLELRRLALTMAQVEQYNPPPNPAKLSDSRCAGYIQQFGDSSWELDALEPTVLAELVRGNIQALIDPGPWDAQRKKIVEGRAHLQMVSDRWSDIKTRLDDDTL